MAKKLSVRQVTKRLLSTRQMAEKLGFSVTHIRHLIAQGVIEVEKIGREYYTTADKLKSIKRVRAPNGVHWYDER